MEDKYGSIGRITRFYDDFSALSASCITTTGEDWLAEQEMPFTEKHLQEVWCSIAIRIGGSSWSPLSCLTVLEEDGYYPE